MKDLAKCLTEHTTLGNILSGSSEADQREIMELRENVDHLETKLRNGVEKEQLLTEKVFFFNYFCSFRCLLKCLLLKISSSVHTISKMSSKVSVNATPFHKIITFSSCEKTLDVQWVFYSFLMILVFIQVIIQFFEIGSAYR